MTTLNGHTGPDRRAFMSAAGGWVRAQRAGFVLVGGVILGQLSRVLFETLRHAEFLTSGKPPLLGVLGTAVAVVWCGVIIWARLRIGQDLYSWARGWFASFAVADTIPRRYVIADRGALLSAALCAVVDLVLLLVMQSTVRAPLLMVTGLYTSQAWADGAFVIVVIFLALLVLSHIYQTSKPVAAYLAWSVMDRLVPTAGFLAAPAAPALQGTRTGSQPALDEPAHRSDQPNQATAPPESVHQEPTVVAEKKPEAPSLTDEPTIRAPAVDAGEPTIRAPAVDAAEPTDRAPSVDPEQTAVSERTVVADTRPEVKGDQR